MPPVSPPFDPAELTVRELLASSVAVVDELLRRELIRTRNAPLGDVAETLVLRAYGGKLAPNSEKSYDLRTTDDIRVQVKARMVQPRDRRSQSFSAVRSWDFELAVFVVFDAATYDLVWARELTRSDARALARKVEHTNSWAILARHVENAGTDVTARLATAYERLDEPRDQG